MKQKDVFKVVAHLTGQNNILTIPAVFIDFTADLETALFLSQLLYWTGKTKDGWIYKTYKDWEKEIKLSRRKVDKARKKLVDLGIIETKLKKANGSPTVHYKLKVEVFIGLLTEFINRQNEREENDGSDAQNEQMDLYKMTNGFVQNEQIESYEMNKSNCSERAKPLTEITTETTTEITANNIYSAAHLETKKRFGEFNNVLLTEGEYQKLKEKLGDLADKLIEDLSLYIASRGKKYKSHYATILSWSRKEQKPLINATNRQNIDIDEHNKVVIEKLKQRFKGVAL